MKKFIPLFLLLSSLAFTHEKEVSLSEVQDILNPINDATSFIIKINKGDELPIHFKMSGDAFDFGVSSLNASLKAKEVLYIKIEPSFLFSDDKKNWKSLESYFTGELGAKICGENAPEGEFSLNLNRR